MVIINPRVRKRARRIVFLIQINYVMTHYLQFGFSSREPFSGNEVSRLKEKLIQRCACFICWKFRVGQLSYFHFIISAVPGVGIGVSYDVVFQACLAALRGQIGAINADSMFGVASAEGGK